MTITAAERAAGLRFREEFRNTALLSRDGGLLSGVAAIDENGLSVSSSPDRCRIFVPETDPDNMTLKVVFKPDYAWDDVVSHYILDTPAANRVFTIYKSSADKLVCDHFGTSLIDVSGGGGTWSDVWSTTAYNTLIVRYQSGLVAAWLNGTLVGTSAVTSSFGAGLQFDTVYVGSSEAASNYSGGYFRSVEVVGHGIDNADEPVLRNGTLISDIRFDRSLITLPLRHDYAISGVQSTPIEGTHKAVVSHATMGNGSTPSTFPTHVTNKRTGYVFDGGDYIEIPNHADLQAPSFTKMTLAAFVDPSGVGGTPLAKFTSIGNGEWYTMISTGGLVAFSMIDTANSARSGRRTDLIGTESPYVFVGTYGGSADPKSDIAIYIGGIRYDIVDIVVGAFSSVQPTSDSLTIGKNMLGVMAGVYVRYGFSASPMQVRALTHMIEQEVLL